MKDPGPALFRLANIMQRLRAPGGCPWDREQHIASLRPYLVEECFEVLEEMDKLAEGADWGPYRDELGDLLFQIVFHAHLATELGRCASLGAPLVHCEAYDVLPNRLYGVAGGYRAKVCWVVLGPQLRGRSPGCQEPGTGRVRWLDELPAEVRDPICDCRWSFRHFPHLKTFLNKPSSLIDLTLPESQAMAHFTSWAVVESGPQIKDFLALETP